MTISIKNELCEKIATELATLGFTLMKGIVRQAAPDYDVQNGVLLQGEAKFPFVSVSGVLEESFNVAESFNSVSAVTRTITVAIVADKKIVSQDDDLYALYRQNAMRTIHTNRFRGMLTSDTNSCILQATVRPRSPIEKTAWQSYGKFISAFDVLFQTNEPNVVI